LWYLEHPPQLVGDPEPAYSDLVAAVLPVVDRLLGHEAHAVAERARAALATVGLQGMDERYPSELSGGQQQTAYIMRALAPKLPKPSSSASSN
jgi:ABC-type histidine transport system ATPase subunit